MHHVVVIEAAHHVGNGVCLADVCQELVAQALALGGPGHQPGDIDEFHGRRQYPLRADDLLQHGKAFVRYRHHAGVGLDGAEREILGLNARLGEGVE
jgi:hypothetical protein